MVSPLARGPAVRHWVSGRVYRRVAGQLETSLGEKSLTNLAVYFTLLQGAAGSPLLLLESQGAARRRVFPAEIRKEKGKRHNPQQNQP